MLGSNIGMLINIIARTIPETVFLNNFTQPFYIFIVLVSAEKSYGSIVKDMSALMAQAQFPSKGPDP